MLSASGELSQYEAVATSLVAMVPTGLMGTLVNAAKGTVHYRIGMVLSLSSSVAIYTTARYIAPQIEVCQINMLYRAQYIPNNSMLQRINICGTFSQWY